MRTRQVWSFPTSSRSPQPSTTHSWKMRPCSHFSAEIVHGNFSQIRILTHPPIKSMRFCLQQVDPTPQSDLRGEQQLRQNGGKRRGEIWPRTCARSECSGISNSSICCSCACVIKASLMSSEVQRSRGTGMTWRGRTFP